MTRKRYTAHAERAGAWWAIEVDGVRNAVSQARRLEQVEAMAREVVALLLDVGPDTFDIDVEVHVPEQWSSWVEELRAKQAAQSRAERAASTSLRETARRLKESGLPVRDVGSIMGVSPQRVSQLLAS